MPYLAVRINGVPALDPKLMQHVPDGVISTLRSIRRIHGSHRSNPIYFAIGRP
jgi:hypothetical protein